MYLELLVTKLQGKNEYIKEILPWEIWWKLDQQYVLENFIELRRYIKFNTGF